MLPATPAASQRSCRCTAVAALQRSLVLAACLSFSAFFELLEWWAALIAGGAADAYLATQGDVWDTQWDMFLALTGAALAQATLARVHDRQLGLPPVHDRQLGLPPG